MAVIKSMEKYNFWIDKRRYRLPCVMWMRLVRQLREPPEV